ncbi:MAG: hypothetical protein WCS97_00890 [Candidatus Paceibacterota bacterium]|jgi:hypothetical protein
MSNKYIEYLKNNPQGYWFKRKLYGWGWVPVRWQGWAVVAVSMLYIVLVSLDFSEQAELAKALGADPTNGDLISFFAKIALAVVVIISFCYWKGESPRWQWGVPKD